jgi:fucose permease
MNSHCKKTMTACFIGYITQAITTNFVPLLYYDFQRQFKIELEKITLIIVLTFLIQFLTDLFASKYVCKIGYRKCLVTAHLLCAIGFVLMTVLPSVMNSFTGIILSVAVYATGSGLLEVIISPVVQSCPTKNKEGIMSFLHSFYCWGVVATVVISTVFL